MLSGKRYEVVSQELKDYVRGLYGKPPGRINPHVKEKILGSEEPITCRPADLLKPMLPGATDGVDPALIHNEEDIISYCLFPGPALDFFKWRSLPIEERPTTPAQLEMKQAKAPRADEQKKDRVPEAPPRMEPLLPDRDYRFVNELMARMRDLQCSELIVRRDDLMISLRTTGSSAPSRPAASADDDTATPAAAETTATAPASPSAEPEPKAPAGPSVDAPLGGTFYASPAPGKPALVKIGDVVAAGVPVCVVEAMKLFNEIKAPSDCRIVKYLAEHGQAVKKDDPLVAIQPL